MIILASKSPRRKEILKQMGISFCVMNSGYEENNALAVSPAELVRIQAEGKARTAYKRTDPANVVIGADTLVVLDGNVLGKPENENQALVMLQQLSGRTHQVITGVAVFANGHHCSDVCISKVTFRKLTNDEILRYIATGEPMDKAGAYGIQGLGKDFVESVEGSLTNVIGLPKDLTQKLLQQVKETR